MIALIRPPCPNPKALIAGNYKHPDNKNALRKSTSGKCMYCESKMEHNSFSQIEHIKPKSKFPELEFEWENLGFSCEWCNNNKRDKYSDKMPFINPYNENPEDNIEFKSFIISPKQGSERGLYTINEIDLNRAGLIEDRKEKIDKINMMISAANRTSSESLRNQTIEAVKEEAEKDKEYSAMIKSVLLAEGILEPKKH